MSEMDHLPIPTLTITEAYAVVESSETARAAFLEAESLLDMVDMGSRDKLKRFVRPAMSGMKVELNFLTKNGIGLFDVYQRWRNREEGMRGYITCVPRQSSLDEVVESVSRLEKRLARRHAMNALMRDDASARPTIWEHITHSIHTLEELMSLVHADLIERGRGVYAELVLKELDSLQALVAEEQRRAAAPLTLVRHHV
ncbi:hypothetical protein [Alicyclobacillus vulcanalis]|uniref:Uncharacterized protein n=1 Tax=Alicyclobacillus vulcanalis TaxID=252246 RepID=A0A1N7NZW4_9BACL|nr:hypothetical protein [Alicyclobacillus vulcanalis]SIT03887.1 hypothetical protein SAMN05421799_110113 [Alicyclobacillus vulcanalis]